MTKKNEKCKLKEEVLKSVFEKYFFKSGYMCKSPNQFSCAPENRSCPINFKHRYSVWDSCYNYFQDEVFNEEKEEVLNEKKEIDFKQAGLHLGFYLASWGMFRNSELLNQGSEFFEKLAEKIKEIGNHKNCFPSEECFKTTYVKIKCAIEGCENQSNEECSGKKDCECCENTKLVCCKKMEEKKEKKEKSKGKPEDGKVRATDTLVTKIMLGVYGNFPAVDSNFKSALRHYSIGISGNKKCSKEKAKDVWKKISDVYELEVKGYKCEDECNNNNCIKKNNLKCFIKKLRGKSGLPEKFSDAKILDALFFTIGDKILDNEKEKKKKEKPNLSLSSN